MLKFRGKMGIALKIILFSSGVFFVRLSVFEIWSFLYLVDFNVCASCMRKIEESFTKYAVDANQEG